MNIIIRESIELLRQLISTPSLSRQENQTATILENFIGQFSKTVHRKGNNVWSTNLHFDVDKPTILLNSHHDTVKPAQGWTKDPFKPVEENGQLFGLGSNDAGASLVSLIATFRYFYPQKKLPYNLVIAATAEEEISGANGIASIIEDLPTIKVGIIGEPTQMRMAIAEKGLMVVDGTAHGKSGHAAREEGINALYIALEDIDWIRKYEFDEISDFLGKTKMTVTQIQAGSQHNVVPDTCSFVIDVRTNELYSNETVFDILQQHTKSELKARSFRLNSSRIDLKHPLVQKGIALGHVYYGSPTLSDQALLQGFPTLKMGCGKSARSHTADEFIYLKEIEEGIAQYIRLLEGLVL